MFVSTLNNLVDFIILIIYGICHVLKSNEGFHLSLDF